MCTNEQMELSDICFRILQQSDRRYDGIISQVCKQWNAIIQMIVKDVEVYVLFSEKCIYSLKQFFKNFDNEPHYLQFYFEDLIEEGMFIDVIKHFHKPVGQNAMLRFDLHNGMNATNAFAKYMSTIDIEFLTKIMSEYIKTIDEVDSILNLIGDYSLATVFDLCENNIPILHEIATQVNISAFSVICHFLGRWDEDKIGEYIKLIGTQVDYELLCLLLFDTRLFSPFPFLAVDLIKTKSIKFSWDELLNLVDKRSRCRIGLYSFIYYCSVVYYRKKALSILKSKGPFLSDEQIDKSTIVEITFFCDSYIKIGELLVSKKYTKHDFLQSKKCLREIKNNKKLINFICFVSNHV